MYKSNALTGTAWLLRPLNCCEAEEGGILLRLQLSSAGDEAGGGTPKLDLAPPFFPSRLHAAEGTRKCPFFRGK